MHHIWAAVEGLSEVFSPITLAVDQGQYMARVIRKQGRYRSSRRQRTERRALIDKGICDGKRVGGVRIREHCRSCRSKAGIVATGGVDRSVIGIVEPEIIVRIHVPIQLAYTKGLFIGGQSRHPG